MGTGDNCGGSNGEEEPGVRVVADGAAREVHLHMRSLHHPEQLRVSALPLLEQWTSALIEEDLVGALEQVLFDGEPQ